MSEKTPILPADTGFTDLYCRFTDIVTGKNWNFSTHAADTGFSDGTFDHYRLALSETITGSGIYKPATWPLANMPADGTYLVSYQQGALSTNALDVRANRVKRIDDHFVISGGHGVPDGGTVNITATEVQS